MRTNNKNFIKSIVPDPIKKFLLEALRPWRRPSPTILNFLAYKGDFKVKVGNAELAMTYTNKWIENDLFWQGLAGYEKVSVDLWISLAKSARTIVDIGANTGLFALLAKTANPSAVVFAFEPLPKFRDILTKNCMLNNYDISVQSYAVSNFLGTSTFYIPKEYQGNQYASSLSKEHYLRHQDTPPQELEVQVTTFDAFASQNNIQGIDLIKIDAEGHDYQVIEGMRETIKRYKPDFLVEIQSEDVARGIMSLLPPDEYRYFNIHEVNGARSVSALSKSDTYNFLICKSETADTLGTCKGAESV